MSALELRILGRSFEEIGRLLKMSRQGAHDAVKRSLEQYREGRRELGELQLDLELATVDKIAEGMMPEVEKGDARAALAMLKAMDRRAKLLGLDKPAQVDVTSGGKPITVFVPDEKEP